MAGLRLRGGALALRLSSRRSRAIPSDPPPTCRAHNAAGPLEWRRPSRMWRGLRTRCTVRATGAATIVGVGCPHARRIEARAEHRQ